jgi:uncharacterized protein (UPF0332 family)
MNIKYYLNNKEKIQESYDFFIRKEQLTKITSNKELIEAHIRKAEHNLGILKQLDENYNDWKIIGLYYCLYHSCLALLANKGYSSKNHTATLIFLLKEYSQITNDEINLIEELQIKDEDAKFYTQLKQERHNANYSTDAFYDNQKIEEFRLKTVAFLNKVRDILKLNK